MFPFKKPDKQKEIDDLIQKIISSIVANEQIHLSDEDQFKIIRSVIDRFKGIKAGKMHDSSRKAEQLNKLLSELNEK